MQRELSPDLLALFMKGSNADPDAFMQLLIPELSIAWGHVRICRDGCMLDVAVYADMDPHEWQHVPIIAQFTSRLPALLPESWEEIVVTRQSISWLPSGPSLVHSHGGVPPQLLSLLDSIEQKGAPRSSEEIKAAHKVVCSLMSPSMWYLGAKGRRCVVGGGAEFRTYAGPSLPRSYPSIEFVHTNIFTINVGGQSHKYVLNDAGWWAQLLPPPSAPLPRSWFCRLPSYRAGQPCSSVSIPKGW